MTHDEQVKLSEIALIEYLGKEITLSSGGDNDVEGHQIFTPDFIVKSMMKLVGTSNINDINSTILESTSGDGAFTVRILEQRIKSLKKDENFLLNALRALSTIYSIELDQQLLLRQRSNLYSTFINLTKLKQIKENEKIINLLKEIIFHNVIWGETNIQEEFTTMDIIGWFMPIPKIKVSKRKEINNYIKAQPIKFARWTINSDFSYSYSFEDAEFDHSLNEDQIGGLFDEKW